MSTYATCYECGKQLVVNRWTMAQVQLFCANEACDMFVMAFWTERDGTITPNGRMRYP